MQEKTIFKARHLPSGIERKIKKMERNRIRRNHSCSFAETKLSQGDGHGNEAPAPLRMSLEFRQVLLFKVMLEGRLTRPVLARPRRHDIGRSEKGKRGRREL
jgi:hypothetical protein